MIPAYLFSLIGLPDQVGSHIPALAAIPLLMNRHKGADVCAPHADALAVKHS